jgi:acetyl-CoA acyltransferase
MLFAEGYYMGMGETAENLARDLGITREEQEAFAVRSHELALKARAEGGLDREIVPVEYNGKTIAADEGPRTPDLPKMKSLEPAFLQGGTITAATSSPVSIGAAALLVASEAFASKAGLKPRARIVSRAVAGVEPTRMGMGPIPASAKALERAGLAPGQIDYFELNEAFAAQALFVLRKTGWPLERVNVHGGAIALGHPLGASGTRILATLLSVLEQRGGTTGLATMCIGTGQGIATIIRRN